MGSLKRRTSTAHASHAPRQNVGIPASRRPPPGGGKNDCYQCKRKRVGGVFIKGQRQSLHILSLAFLPRRPSPSFTKLKTSSVAWKFRGEDHHTFIQSFGSRVLQNRIPGTDFSSGWTPSFPLSCLTRIQIQSYTTSCKSFRFTTIHRVAEECKRRRFKGSR
jgi:hypothetical protein